MKSDSLVRPAGSAICALALVAATVGACGQDRSDVLQGRWLVGDGSSYHTLLAVEDDVFKASGLAGGPPRSGQFRAEAHGDGHVTLRGDGDRALELFLESPHRGRALLPGTSGLAFVRRVTDLPEAMAGEWTIGFSDNYHLSGGVMTLAPDRWTVTVGPHTKRDFRAYPLATGGALANLALVADDGRTRTLRFARAGDGLLAWFAGTDEYFVLHRGADRPAWLPPERPTRENPFLDQAR